MAPIGTLGAGRYIGIKNGMANGTIKWFNTKNGLGLIIDENGDKVRLHFSAFKDDSYKTIQAGDPVSFETKEGRRGPEATICQKR